MSALVKKPSAIVSLLARIAVEVAVVLSMGLAGTSATVYAADEVRQGTVIGNATVVNTRDGSLASGMSIASTPAGSTPPRCC